MFSQMSFCPEGRLSTGVSPLDREPPDRDPWAETPWTETPLVGQRPPLLDRLPPWTETPSKENGTRQEVTSYTPWKEHGTR